MLKHIQIPNPLKSKWHTIDVDRDWLSIYYWRRDINFNLSVYAEKIKYCSPLRCYLTWLYLVKHHKTGMYFQLKIFNLIVVLKIGRFFAPNKAYFVPYNFLKSIVYCRRVSRWYPCSVEFSRCEKSVIANLAFFTLFLFWS